VNERNLHNGKELEDEEGAERARSKEERQSEYESISDTL